MTQNSSLRSDVSNMEGIPLSWSYRDVFFYIKLDSQNRIYRFAFRAPTNQQNAMKALGKIIADQNLDFLCESLLKRCLEFEKESMPLLFQDPLFQKSAYQLRQALLFLKGIPPDYLRRTEFGTRYNPNDLLCTCVGVMKSEVSEYYRTYHANKKDFIKETDVSMNCGQCLNDLDSVWEEISKDSLLNMEVKLFELKNEFKNALSEFSEFTHLELAQNDLDIVEISDTKVTLRATRDLRGIDQLKLDNALANYFNGHLQMNIKVVFLGNS